MSACSAAAVCCKFEYITDAIARSMYLLYSCVHTNDTVIGACWMAPVHPVCVQNFQPGSAALQVYQVCPQTLLPVLPRLAEELHADDAKQRAGAASLVGSLFSLPGSDLATSYADLFDALLKRLEDREVSPNKLLAQSVLYHLSRLLQLWRQEHSTRHQ